MEAKTSQFKTMEKGFTLLQAVIEAERCLLCHDAPCSKGCPANTDPGTFIRKLRLKNITGAIRTVKTNNILGGACGVLCPTHRLCEKECSATGIGRPIAIGQIQRFLVEHSWETGFTVFEKPAGNKEKVAVVGSGPAGLSCAAELAQKGYKVTVFEALPEPGGVIRYGVPSYRFDKRFFENELKDIRGLGVEIKCNKPIARDGVPALLKEGYKAAFLSPGLWEAEHVHKNLKPMKGVYSSVDFLKSCRAEDISAFAAEVKGKNVAVLGGGSVAIDCAVSAVKLGAKNAYLVYRRSFQQMPAEEDERIHAMDEGVQFLLLSQPVDFKEAGGRVAAVVVRRTELGDPDASGRRKPVEIPGSDWELKADVVVEAIGNKALAESASWYPGVAVDGKSLIKADGETGKTSLPGVFAGGDIVRGPSLVVEAVQDGKNAAKAIAAYLSA